MTARYLVDESALARMPHAAVRERLAPIIEAGEAATCGIVDLEVLFSARKRGTSGSALGVTSPTPTCR